MLFWVAPVSTATSVLALASMSKAVFATTVVAACSTLAAFAIS